jgi:hypothetical protein
LSAFAAGISVTFTEMPLLSFDSIRSSRDAIRRSSEIIIFRCSEALTSAWFVDAGSSDAG